VNNPDTTAPSAAITAPTSGQTLGGTVAVGVSAIDNVGVTKVELFVDNALRTTNTTSPYTFTLDTSSLANGTHALVAKAYDVAGNVGISSTVTVQVQNATVDSQAPVVSIASPTNGSVVSPGQVVTVSASATDNVGVTRVDLFASGKLLCTATAAPYACAWKVPRKGGASYALQAKGYDAAGNVGSSALTGVTTVR
jgi:hypothetical protein